MKPKVFCGKCEAPIAIGDEVCPKCGTSAEWSAEAGESSSESKTESRACPGCGTENPSESEFCGSCGARLQGGKKRRGRGAQHTETRGDSRKKEGHSTPLFSSKVIFGFLGILIVVVIALEVFPGREPDAPSQATPSGPSEMPTANLQAMNQISDLERRVAADPSDTQAMLTLANLCQDGRFLDKAITYYKKYLDKNPKDANARVDLGISYFEKDETGEAIKQMQTALKYDPKHIQAHYNLGIVNLKARKVQEANEWFRKTITLAGPNSEMGQQAKQILEQHSSPLNQNK